MANGHIHNATTEVAKADGGETAAAGTTWTNPETWILVGFTLFAVLALRYLVPMIGKLLDKRSETIRHQLEAASRLRAEAQEMLAQYQREQADLLKQAEEIVASAKRDAAELRERAAEDLKLALDRRSQQAEEKISRAEAEAVEAIRTHIVESATDMAKGMLAQKAQSQSDDQMVASVVQAIKQQIH